MNETNLRRLSWWGLLLALGPISAGAVDVEPSITLAEIYTSNVDLAPSGSEESAWVTRVAPGVSVDYAGPGLLLGLDYTLEALLYANDSDRNGLYNQLDSSALLDLAGKDLQLRAAAGIEQVNIAPERPTSNSNVNTTNNRGDARFWSIGPQWRRNVLETSELDGFATVGHVNFTGAGSQDVDTTAARISLHTNQRMIRTTFYDFAYEYNKLQYDISGDAVVQTAYARAGYQYHQALQVFGLVGLDNNFADPTDYSLGESRWEVGFRTSFGASVLRAAVGHRYFGSTYSFSWDLVQPDSSYRLSYTESPTTSDLTGLRELPTTPAAEGETPPPPQPDSSLDRPGNPTRFLIKRGDAGASWSFFRSELSFDLFWEGRQDQVFVADSAVTNTSLNDEESYGAGLEFQWEVGARSVASVGASWSHRDFNNLADSGCNSNNVATCTAPADSDQLASVHARLDYALGSRTSLGAGMGFQSSSGSVAGDYDEFSAAVQLVRTF